MYNLIIRPLLFCIDPEKVHRMLLSWLKFYRYLFPVRACVRGYSRVSDPFSYGHLQFKNRIGLSAGFDKNAEAFDELADFGFGFLEVRNNRVHANLIHHYAKHMYDVAGIYTLGSQPKSYVTENCVHSIYKPGYVHDPNHWFYLYTDEGSSFITVRDNWTEGEKYLQNANGPGNVWENNGPKVDSVIRERAGVEAAYKDLLNY